MAHILLVASSIRGVLNRIGGFGSYLQEAGYQVTMVVPESVEHIIHERGLAVETFKEFHPNGPFARTWWIKGKKPAKGNSRMDEALASLELERFDEIVHRLNPDLLLIDIEQHQLVIHSHQYDIPFAVLLGWYTIWKRPGLPPMSRVSIPGQGWSGSRLGMEMSWWWHWLKKGIRDWKFWLRDSGTDRISILRAVAKKSGFPFRKEAELFQWMYPMSYKTLPVITTVTEALELPHTPRPNLYYVGPIIHLNRKEVEFTSPETDAVLNKLFDASQSKSNDHKVIYAATSTITAPDLSLVHRIIETMRSKPQWDLILGIGKKLSVDQLGDLPPNVHPFSWVPQLRVLSQADCCITHGGINTINECIHFKVPMVVYSGKATDEPGASARVGFHQIGVLGNKEKDSPKDIEGHINKVLTDPAIAQNVDRVHNAYLEDQPKGLLAVKALLPTQEPLEAS